MTAVNQTYAWEVEGTLEVDTRTPSVNHPGTTHKYRRPVWFIASAETLEQALAKVREKYPDIVFVKGYRTRHVEGMIV